jgi:hypothetical protein
LENSAVSKTQKMKMFGSHNIKPLIALFNWTGSEHSFFNCVGYFRGSKYSAISSLANSLVDYSPPTAGGSGSIPGRDLSVSGCFTEDGENLVKSPYNYISVFKLG